jgi:hypothetical protein
MLEEIKTTQTASKLAQSSELKQSKMQVLRSLTSTKNLSKSLEQRTSFVSRRKQTLFPTMISTSEKDSEVVSPKVSPLPQQSSTVENLVDLSELLGDFKVMESFRKFCAKEHSAELLDFFFATEAYKGTANMEARINMAASIRKRFLAQEEYFSPFGDLDAKESQYTPITASEREIEKCTARISSGDFNIFDDLQSEVKRDIYGIYHRWRASTAK